LTTTTTVIDCPFLRNRFLHFAIAVFIAIVLASAYHPERMTDWILENLLVVALIAVIALSYRWLPLSNLSYLLILMFLALHEWGAHHKYADVPLGEWMKGWFKTNRNHYDRVIHFLFGLLLSYPIREVFLRRSGAKPTWCYYLAVDVCLAFGACYEILESIIASIVSPEDGEAFVGMQGDMWDAQKDMGLGGLGAAVTMGALATWKALRKRRLMVSERHRTYESGTKSRLTP
jgi:putative membrane protein